MYEKEGDGEGMRGWGVADGVGGGGAKRLATT